MSLLNLRDLATWAREEIDPADQFAKAMVEAASDAVRAAAQQPAWTAATAPVRARQIAAHLAARSYLNPTSIQGEGSLGPIGGDRYVEELSKALHLTQAERDELAGLAPAAGSAGRGLWIQPIATGAALDVSDVFLPDDSGSDWMIPYLAGDDDFPALG